MNTSLITTRYCLPSHKYTPPLCIALVADLHDHNPEFLLKKIRLEKPDLIFVAGDTFERHEKGHPGCSQAEIDSWLNTSLVWRLFCRFIKLFEFIFSMINTREGEKENIKYGRLFLKEAAKIAPVYMSVGNHEWYFLPEDRILMKECGVTLLDNRDVTISIKGHDILIGGLSTRYDLDWLKTFSGKEGYKILLSHHPEYYLRYIKNQKIDTFDLIVAGHAHGGQWRILNRGVMSPGQGLFPKYVHGAYDRLVVSAGVSNTSVIPRWGNPCELVIINVTGKSPY